MWCIQVSLIVFDGQYEKLVHIPTFYLNVNVQGIVDQNHAIEVAKKIVMPVKNSNIKDIMCSANLV